MRALKMLSIKKVGLLQIAICFVFFMRFSLADNFTEHSTSREKRVLNIFSVVRFPNSVCSGSSYNGTCYSSTECTQLGGTSSGTCAAGYGVCCIFTLTCGGTSSQNCTYFISSGSEVGQCRVKICPCSTNICQMRLDFSTFVINQPVTSTASVAKILNAKTVTAQTQCQTDQFSVTTPGNVSPPVICGTNSGTHMYMDASDLCNDLYFNLMSGTSTVTRSWNIKITQYSCDYNNLAPEGCTQYFYGSTTGSVKTYNFDGGQQLADQNQNICVRQERSYCQICWTQAATTDFELSSAKTGATGTVKLGTGCCGYGPAASGKTATGYDCAVIPQASSSLGAIKTALANGICGGRLGLTAASTTAKTVCSKKTPFNIRFVSDHWEWSGTESTKTPNGFKLIYTLKSC